MSGKYQNSNNLESLIANWDPSQMLPRAYKDIRSIPPKINGIAEGMF